MSILPLAHENLKYIIDSSSLIAMHNEIYCSAVFPDVHHNFEELVRQGVVLVLPEVIVELKKKADGIMKSIKKVQKNVSAPKINNGVVSSIIDEISQKFPKMARKQGSADLNVIATAEWFKINVVTEEGQDAKTKIPAACKERGVRYYSLYGMMQNEKWRFINAPNAP